MPEKRFFHELTPDERQALEDSHMTWRGAKKQFKQPDWCQYPGALDGEMGCWSLVLGRVTGQEFCKGCDLNKEVTL